MPLYNVHPLFTICLLSNVIVGEPIAIYWALFQSPNTLLDPGIEPLVWQSHLRPLSQRGSQYQNSIDCLVDRVVASATAGQGVSGVARSLELCPVYSNRLAPYYMELITQMMKSGCTLFTSAYPFGDKRRKLSHLSDSLREMRK
ncbi:hypothetical protein SFRURICE_019856, partial [Spodoptera frugiperda]